MRQEIIKVVQNEEGVQTVNARELWEFLGSKREFATWIKERIKKYEFKEGSDYMIDKFVTKYNQVLTIDYFITMDMAKELSMIQRINYRS